MYYRRRRLARAPFGVDQLLHGLRLKSIRRNPIDGVSGDNHKISAANSYAGEPHPGKKLSAVCAIVKVIHVPNMVPGETVKD